nr:MAG TPA: hypothetical protein [Caudoviricetes sp.]
MINMTNLQICIAVFTGCFLCFFSGYMKGSGK